MAIKTILFYYQYQKSFLVMVAFLVGIAIHSLFPLTKINSTQQSIIVFIGLFSYKIIYHFIKYKKNIPVLKFIFGFIFLGFFWFNLAIPAPIIIHKVYQGQIMNKQNSRYGTRMVIALKNNNFLQARSKIYLYTKQKLSIGDNIKFSCQIKKFNQRPNDTMYKFTMSQKRAQGSCRTNQLQVLKTSPFWDIREYLWQSKKRLNQRIQKIIPGDNGVLIAGVLYGEQNMSQRSQELFRQAGLTHLIAVSGSNFTLIISLMSIILLNFGFHRRQSFWVINIGIIFFLLFVGFSASVARAAFMGFLLLFARHTGRLAQVSYTLLISAFILCLINPFMLFFDVGFALSFLATIGLMVWTPIFTKYLQFIPQKFGLQEIIVTTLSANIMTIPYTAFCFDKMSFAGLITNLFAIPLVPWLMLFGFFNILWGQFFGWQYLILPALGLSKMIFLSAKITEYIPWLNIKIQHMDFIYMIGIYTILYLIWLKKQTSKKISTKISIFC